MSSAEPQTRQLASDTAAHVESIVARFEAAVRRGEAPAIESFLPADTSKLGQVLVELVHTDLEYRLKAGESVRVEGYLVRFPQLRADAHELRNLIAAEFEFRRRQEASLSVAEYVQRFPQFEAELPGLLLPTVANPSDSAVNADQPTLRIEPDEQARVLRRRRLPAEPALLGYEILDELGRGGMGVVYRAREPKHGKAVALKTLPWVDAGALYRFKQEFRALADVSHPNLVTLHELVSDGERWFFTMELVDGLDFLSYVRSPIDLLDQDTQVIGKGLSAEQAQKLRGALLQLTDGLLALHEAGKLHRDIKPRNVLVTEAGRVVLLDFGLAADLGSSGVHQSSERHIIGTLSYMSPEQAAALPLTAATDWFSVGVMLYEVLTGELPQLDRSALPAEWQPISGPIKVFQPPIEVAPETPADLSEICVELLRTDPETRLTGRDLYKRLRATAPAIETSRLSTPSAIRQLQPFIGRERQLQELHESLQRVRSGKTEVVFVHGRSGTGKTALIQRFFDSLEVTGPSVVLAGRCYERESVPYKALDSAVDALSRYLKNLPEHDAEALLPRNVLSLARVFPVLRRVPAVGKASGRSLETPDPQELRRRAFSALRELLARLGDRKPLILYIDDLQWGDIDSAELLSELLRPPDPPVMMLLGCYRAEDANSSPLLTKLFTSLDQSAPIINRRMVSVDTLSPREAQELAHLLLGEEGPLATERAAAVARESRGNAFFVQELVQYLKGGAGLVDRPSSTGEILLDRVLWERVQGLPEDTRRLLEVLAVAGQPLRPAQVAVAAEVPQESRPSISALRSSHLIKARGAADDSHIEPYHDRIRETIVAHLPAEQLREYHRRLAITLDASPDADPEMLAMHYQGSGDLEKAGDCFATAAGRASEALAFEHATKLYRLSLKLRPVSGSEERLLLMRLGVALANAGRGAEAAKEFLKAAATADKSQALALQRKAAEQYMVSGHIDEGLAVLDKVLAAVGLKLPATPRQALISLLWNRARLWLRGRGFRERPPAEIQPDELMRIDACWSVSAGLSMVDTIRGADFQTRQLLYALKSGEPSRVARAISFEAGHLASEGGRRAKQARELLDVADKLSEQLGTPQSKATALAARGIVAALLGQWPEARDCSDQAEALFRDHCTGVAWELGTVHRFAFWARVFMGEMREVAHRLPTLLKDARERNDLYAVTNLNNTVLPMVYLAADEPDRIEAEVYANEAPPRKEFHVQHYVRLFDLSQTDMYCGRGRAAWERIVDQWPLLSGSFLLRVQQIRIFMLYVRGRSAISAAKEMPGERAKLLQAAEADAARLARERMPWSTGLAESLYACLAATRGDKVEAGLRFGRAAAQLDEVSMGLHAAASRRRQGILLGGEAGRALVEQADAWMAGQIVRNPERITNMLAPV